MSARLQPTPARKPDDVEERVRLRLRQVRQDAGLTLAQVAEAAGMAISTLSRLESGARRLTLAHLPPLATALGIDTADLLRGGEDPDPRVRREPTNLDGFSLLPLSREGAAGMQVYKLELPATRTQRPDDLRTHEGNQWIYVVRGRLRLLLADDEFVLMPGEAAEFSTWTPHWMGVVEEAVELLTIYGPHGERLQLRT
ncbi:MAG: XRE family transcriptional regulator [Solirubrobacteraceae bacterium]|nr:XRE family transcriptional regulator [Solirubrobacteraceae bacterium]